MGAQAHRSSLQVGDAEEEPKCGFLYPRPLTDECISRIHMGIMEQGWGLSWGLLISILLNKDFPGLGEAGCKEEGKGACWWMEGDYGVAAGSKAWGSISHQIPFPCCGAERA